MADKIDIPNPIAFILHTPLYEAFNVEGEAIWEVIALKYFKGTLDCYCPDCKRDATFRGITPNPPGEHIRDKSREGKRKAMGMPVDLPTLDADTFEVKLQCTRNNRHHHTYIFLFQKSLAHTEHGTFVISSSITKVGQYPSFADLNLSNVKKYKSVLNNQLIGELSRAIGLASHDVGVGSYVYLRRVFEALVEEAHQEAQTSEGWDEKQYLKLRMIEKIKALRDYLPNFLVDNPAMYSLLSKGVHELTEKECLDHFDALKIGIELILDQKLEEKEKAQKIKQAKSALDKAGAKLGKTSA